jgi:DNA topoisomerase VI subunit B
MGARQSGKGKGGGKAGGQAPGSRGKAPQLGLFAGEPPAGKGGEGRKKPRPALGKASRDEGPALEDVQSPLPIVQQEQVRAAGEDLPAEPAVRGKRGPRAKSAAELSAARQREISVSEFFTKNRHLLGFDNPAKALLTAVKEAVDNSLDACEEAKILPEIKIGIEQLAETRFRVHVVDNGPGIVRAQIPKVFGKLLYGSKFHRLKQSRGQQGIGISAAAMYGQLTTGKPAVIISRTGAGRPAYRFEVKIDTRKNNPEWTEAVTDWDQEHGTSVELEIEAVYRGGRRSVDQYVEQTAIANPHLRSTFRNPKGEERVFERLTDALPREATEIKPHPQGVELGALMTMLKDTRGRDLRGALMRDFSRVSERVALLICEAAKLAPNLRPRSLKTEQLEALHRAMAQTKVMSPPTSCVVPIGEELIRRGMEQGVQADFFTSVTRDPAVYRGNPFQIEVGLAWGGQLPGDELCNLIRFANRVPLQYQQSDCAITRAVMETDWRHYRVQQSRGALPSGPLVILVHLASVWVPFTSESKEAVARYPEIVREIKLGLQICGRRLSQHLSARRREADEGRKRSYIETYIPHIGIALKEMLKLTERQEKDVVDTLTDTLRRSRAAV